MTPLRVVARAALAGTLLLSVAVGTTSADHGYWPAAGVDPARVGGHATRTASTEDPASWGTDCTSYGAGDGGLERLDVYGGILDRDYGIVVVLAAREGVVVDGPNGITYFVGPDRGEFVWADFGGNGEFSNLEEADIQTLIACLNAAQPATDTAGGDVKETEPGPLGPLVLALVVAVGVSLALRVGRPR